MTLSPRAISATVFAIGLCLLASPAAAQSASPAAKADTMSTLDTVRVQGERARSRLARERQLVRGNRMLAREVRRLDQKIDSLEKHLDSLQYVGARMWKEVRDLDSATVATRGRRQELERRIAALEGSSTPAPANESASTVAPAAPSAFQPQSKP